MAFITVSVKEIQAIKDNFLAKGLVFEQDRGFVQRIANLAIAAKELGAMTVTLEARDAERLAFIKQAMNLKRPEARQSDNKEPERRIKLTEQDIEKINNLIKELENSTVRSANMNEEKLRRRYSPFFGGISLL